MSPSAVPDPSPLDGGEISQSVVRGLLPPELLRESATMAVDQFRDFRLAGPGWPEDQDRVVGELVQDLDPLEHPEDGNGLAHVVMLGVDFLLDSKQSPSLLGRASRFG